MESRGSCLLFWKHYNGCSALIVKYSSQTDIVRKDLNELITSSFIPAKTPALEYIALEVFSKSNKIALSNECTHLPISFKATRKKQEEMRKRTVVEKEQKIAKVNKGNDTKLSLIPVSVLQVATQMWWLTHLSAKPGLTTKIATQSQRVVGAQI